MLSIEHTFTPHLTLGRLADRASWRQALELAQTLDVRLDTTVAELSVYQIATSGPRQVELVVALDPG
jgi:2'-5' RNA ligase